MATMAIGKPPPEVAQQNDSESQHGKGMTYATTLKPTMSKVIPLPIKLITYLHGKQWVIWEEEEATQMFMNKELEYAVVRKFSYGWLDIQDLRKLIPKQCELKGDVNIKVFSNWYVLIRASRIEDYVHLLSKLIFYIAHRN
ncbi:hypothetical protein FXO37_20292 [Capsicum annuum]|nr:hypothetical protein FXO37_20292 [Capsicum annuum]